MQEVPIRETSLGIHYYFDRLKNCLEEWGYSVFAADRKLIRLVTAVKSDTIIKAMVCRIDEDEHPKWFEVKGTYNGKEISLINVHNRAGGGEGEEKITTFLSTLNPSESSIIGGDFNIRTSPTCPSGRKIESDQTHIKWNHLDYIYYGYTKVSADVLANYTLSVPNRTKPESKAGKPAHYHLPVKGSVCSAPSHKALGRPFAR